jgi:Protein of unknown function (DUF3619)
MTHEDDTDLAGYVSDALDESIEHLDAATLSRLNQARHRALASRHRHRNSLQWLTAGSMAAIAIAILASRLLLTAPDTQTDNMPIASIDDAEFIVVSEDIELLENLDFVAWMVTQGNTG